MSATAAVTNAACVSMEIGGKPYRFSLNLRDLAAAEAHYRAQGCPCNLITSIPIMTHRAVAAIEVLACSLRRHHPDIPPTMLIAQGCLQEVVDTLDKSWPAPSTESEEAERHLDFDLDGLAEASEQFALIGRRRMPLASLAEGLSLAAVMQIFPCALRRARPDLRFGQLQNLMSLRSVYTTVIGMTKAFHAASPEAQERFALRAVGRKDWSGIAHA